MPKRWLSLRGRPQYTNRLTENNPSNDSNHDFDFAFSADSPPALATALPPIGLQSASSLHHERPTTSGGIDGRSRKKLRIDIRPQTSEGNRTSISQPTHRHAASRSQDDLIGIAFGSPSHPPVAFASLAGQMSPKVPDHAFGHQGPFPEKQRKLLPKSWKKIGSLFTVKQSTGKTIDSSVTSSPALSQQPQATKSEESLPRHHWFKNKPQVPEPPTRCPPPPPIHVEHGEEKPRMGHFKRKSSSEGKTMLLDPTPLPSPHTLGETRKAVERPIRLSSLPKLEVDIPNPPLDRYTVMFKNIPAASRSSSLLARRSKTLDSLKSSDGSRNNSQSESEGKPDSAQAANSSEGELLPARRMTDPKLPKPEFPLKVSTSSPTVSKYSLFPPASPAPIKITGKIHHESPLKRTVSSPARLSPMQPNFPTDKPQPLSNARKSSREHDVASPETNTASTEGPEPWSALHSMKSSVSSSNTDEIFFDIKSFRDSRGIEDGQHFVMSRPDSTVVQIARTRSKLNKGSRAKRPANGDTSVVTKPIIPAARADKHLSVSTVNTAVFDEAIAAVEELTSPQATRELSQEARMGLVRNTETVTPTKADVARQSSMSKRDLDLKLLPPDPVLPGRTQSKGRSDHAVRITVPSPITEEVSPLSYKAVSPEKTLANSAQSRDPTSMPLQPTFVQTAQPIAKQTQPALASTKAPQVTTSDSSPRKPVPASSAVQIQPAPQPTKANPAMAKSPQMKAIRRADHPIEESPTIPQGPPPRPYSPSAALALGDKPPPVPAKDSKFIPISKFAAKSTVSKVEQVGVRPARLARSATDTLVTEAHKTGQRLTGLRKAERSATIPPPSASRVASPRVQVVHLQTQAQARPSPQLSSKSNFAGSPALEKNGVHTVTAVVQAAPAAEVSVARTVSLARKQSARVLVPGPKLAARRKEAAEEEQRKRKEQGLEDLELESAPVSEVATPVLVTISSPKEEQGEEEQEQERLRKPSVSIDSTVHPPTERARTPDIKHKLNPLMSHPMDSQISLVSQHSQQSYTSEVSTISKAQERVDQELIEKFKEKDKSKWEVVNGKRMSPIVVEGHRGHKPGMSVGIVLEMA